MGVVGSVRRCRKHAGLHYVEEMRNQIPSRQPSLPFYTLRSKRRLYTCLHPQRPETRTSNVVRSDVETQVTLTSSRYLENLHIWIYIYIYIFESSGRWQLGLHEFHRQTVVRYPNPFCLKSTLLPVSPTSCRWCSMLSEPLSTVQLR